MRSELIESGELARYTRKGTGIGISKVLGTQVALASVAIPRPIERLHFLIGGATQSGKVVTITEMLAGALRRDDHAVVADPNGGYRLFLAAGRCGSESLRHPFRRLVDLQ